MTLHDLGGRGRKPRQLEAEPKGNALLRPTSLGVTVLGSLSLAADIRVEAGEGNDVLVCDNVVQVPAVHVNATVRGGR